MSFGHILATLVTLLAVVALGALRLVGLYSHQAFAAVLGLGLVWAVLSRAVGAWRGTLDRRALWDPRPAMRLQVLGRGGFWLMLTLAAVMIFPRGAEMTPLIAVLSVVGLLRVGLSLLASRTPRPGPSVVMLAGALMLAVDLGRVYLPGPPAALVIQPPFTGDWVVMQGGPSPMVSHHLAAYNQVYALDLLRLDEGRLFDEGATGNPMSQSWEAPLYAPVAGTVRVARGDLADSEGMQLVNDLALAAGNCVVIQSDDGPFVVLAHLRAGSVLVAEGQRVAAGEPIGKVGNSGNTTLPHLHMQVQTHADLFAPDNRSLPFAFADQGGALRRNDRVTGRPQGG